MYYLSDLERLEKCEYTKMSPSTSLETSVKLKGKHRKKNPKGTSQRLAETQPDTLKSHHHTLAQCDSSSLTTRTAQSVVITPTNHNLSSHIHKCSTKDQATDSSHNVTMHPSCISMATDYLEVSSSPQSTRGELQKRTHCVVANNNLVQSVPTDMNYLLSHIRSEQTLMACLLPWKRRLTTTIP